MKKIILTACLLFFSVNISFAAFFVEGRGEYMSTGEFKPVMGFGAGLGIGITDDINVIARFYQTENTEHANLTNETNYEIMAFTAGVEYIPPISFLEEYRIFWKNSISLGRTDLSYEKKDAPLKDLDTVGIIACFRTGLQYNLTQRISPFFDIGYYKSYFADYSDLKLTGWQTTVGVRVHIFGIKDYDDGY